MMITVGPTNRDYLEISTMDHSDVRLCAIACFYDGVNESSLNDVELKIVKALWIAGYVNLTPHREIKVVQRPK